MPIPSTRWPMRNWGLGELDDAIAHFREACEKGCEGSTVGLVLALAVRGEPDDVEEACRIMEGQIDAEQVVPYTQEALEALGRAAPKADPKLRARIEALISSGNGPTSGNREDTWK
jgi:hypothetical protein